MGNEVEEKYDALLSHMAQRLISFLGLPEKRTSDLVEGLKLIREDVAIWTMHDLPRATTTPSPLTEEQIEAIARDIQVSVIEPTRVSGKYVSDIVPIIKRHTSELITVAAPPVPSRNDIYLEAIKAVEVARDDWDAKGRKHWWAQVAQEVIGVLRARAALPPGSAVAAIPSVAGEDECTVAFHRGVNAAKEAIRTEAVTGDEAWFHKSLFINAIARKCGFDRAAPATPTETQCRGNETGFHTCGLPIGGCVPDDD